MVIQDVLNSINSGYQNVTNLIPTKFNFDDQPEYYTINTPDFYDFPDGYVVFIQSDGKVLVAGNSALLDVGNELYYNVIKRFNTDGSLDTGFTSPRFNSYITDIKQQSTGKLIVVGNFNQVGSSYPLDNYNHIVRLNVDGTIDSSFNSGAGFDNEAFVCKVLADDSVIVGGNFGSYNETGSSYLAKLDNNGAIDATFAGNIPSLSQIWTIEEDSSNNLYVAGNMSSVYRLAANGIGDETFDTGAGFNAPVTSIKIDANGKIMIGGYFNQYKNAACNTGVVRLETNANLDTSFAMIGAGLYTPYGEYFGSVSSIAIQNDGKIVVGGYFVNYNSGDVESPIWSRKKGIIRFNSNGTIDTTFNIGYGFDDYVNDLEINANGDIFCVGSFFSYNGKTCTTEFNFGNAQLAGCCAKLSSAGTLISTSLKQNITPIGINDGGNDLWDGGLFFNTNINQSYGSINEESSIPFTHSVLSPAVGDFESTFDMGVVDAFTYNFDPINYNFSALDGVVVSSDEYFGAGSSYFTNMYPGLFVLAASNISIDQFSLTGNIGADGSGDAINRHLDIVVNGKPYAVFYKSKYNSVDPSIIEMIIVSGSTNGITQELYDPLQLDDQVLNGLSGRSELYVLTFSRFDQQDSTEELITGIATQFLSLFTSEVKLNSCASQVCTTPAFKCYLNTNNSCNCSSWKVFYPNCSNVQKAIGVCSGSGAYVPAITVCNQRLF